MNIVIKSLNIIENGMNWFKYLHIILYWILKFTTVKMFVFQFVLTTV